MEEKGSDAQDSEELNKKEQREGIAKVRVRRSRKSCR